MITCMPRGICSWNFDLRGEDRRATVTYGWTERGSVTVDGTRYEIEKQGPLSGRWKLKHAGHVLVKAEKRNPFTRSFRLRTPQADDALHATGLGRTFVLKRENRKIATIRPDHAFTRRSTIECRTDGEEFLVIVFAFWLTALMWRRMAHSSS